MGDVEVSEAAERASAALAEVRRRLRAVRDRAPAEKTCRRCLEPKPSGEFGTDRSRVDGLHPYCRACR